MSRSDLAEEWFADYLGRAVFGWKRKAILREAMTRHSDSWLWLERQREAETDALLVVLRSLRGRGTTPNRPRGSWSPEVQRAVDRLLAKHREPVNLGVVLTPLAV